MSCYARTGTWNAGPTDARAQRFHLLLAVALAPLQRAEAPCWRCPPSLFVPGPDPSSTMLDRDSPIASAGPRRCSRRTAGLRLGALGKAGNGQSDPETHARNAADVNRGATPGGSFPFVNDSLMTS